MPAPTQQDRCPRCGAAFRCGAHDPAPCPCASLNLSVARLAELREVYTGCLCLRCLAEMAEPGSVQHE